VVVRQQQVRHRLVSSSMDENDAMNGTARERRATASFSGML
jgi:hypothetical protein